MYVIIATAKNTNVNGNVFEIIQYIRYASLPYRDSCVTMAKIAVNNRDKR